MVVAGNQGNFENPDPDMVAAGNMEYSDNPNIAGNLGNFDTPDPDMVTAGRMEYSDYPGYFVTAEGQENSDHSDMVTAEGKENSDILDVLTMLPMLPFL
ncbi:hypothetical protein DMENIID0001_170660 [Sergentomyia squamirostris]